MTQRTVWRLIAHKLEPAEAIDWSRRSGRIAIGWGLIGDLGKRAVMSAHEITQLIRESYPQSRNTHLGGPSLWNLYASMREGDLVILRGGSASSLVVEVTGPYEWQSENTPLGGDYRHQRPARVLGIDVDKLWIAAGASPAPGQNMRWTLAQCARPVAI